MRVIDFSPLCATGAGASCLIPDWVISDVRGAYSKTSHESQVTSDLLLSTTDLGGLAQNKLSQLGWVVAGLFSNKFGIDLGKVMIILRNDRLGILDQLRESWN